VLDNAPNELQNCYRFAINGKIENFKNDDQMECENSATRP
jgi:hypothetical protein